MAAVVQNQLRQKPFDGSVYVFRAERADRLKLIYWDGSGLGMAYKTGPSLRRWSKPANLTGSNPMAICLMS